MMHLQVVKSMCLALVLQVKQVVDSRVAALLGSTGGIPAAGQKLQSSDCSELLSLTSAHTSHLGVFFPLLVSLPQQCNLCFNLQCICI